MNDSSNEHNTLGQKENQAPEWAELSKKYLDQSLEQLDDETLSRLSENRKRSLQANRTSFSYLGGLATAASLVLVIMLALYVVPGEEQETLSPPTLTDSDFSSMVEHMDMLEVQEMLAALGELEDEA